MTRWTAEATYRTDAGPLVVPHDFEELDELHNLIERGPHWGALEQIVIRYQGIEAGLTVEQAGAQ